MRLHRRVVLLPLLALCGALICLGAGTARAADDFPAMKITATTELPGTFWDREDGTCVAMSADGYTVAILEQNQSWTNHEGRVYAAGSGAINTFWKPVTDSYGSTWNHTENICLSDDGNTAALVIGGNRMNRRIVLIDSIHTTTAATSYDSLEVYDIPGYLHTYHPDIWPATDNESNTKEANFAYFTLSGNGKIVYAVYSCGLTSATSYALGSNTAVVKIDRTATSPLSLHSWSDDYVTKERYGGFAWIQTNYDGSAFSYVGRKETGSDATAACVWSQALGGITFVLPDASLDLSGGAVPIARSSSTVNVADTAFPVPSDELPDGFSSDTTTTVIRQIDYTTGTELARTPPDLKGTGKVYSAELNYYYGSPQLVFSSPDGSAVMWQFYYKNVSTMVWSDFTNVYRLFASTDTDGALYMAMATHGRTLMSSNGKRLLLRDKKGNDDENTNPTEHRLVLLDIAAPDSSSSGGGSTATVTVTYLTVDGQNDSGVASIQVGQTLSLTATTSGGDDLSHSWSSSDTSVATVSASGTVTAVAAGSATITATGNTTGATGTLSLSVTGGGTSSGTVTVYGDDDVAVGESITLGANSTDSGDTTFTWSSSDTSVATVSDGVVTGIAAGTVTITATGNVSGASGTRTVEVTSSGGTGTPTVTLTLSGGTDYLDWMYFNDEPLTLTATVSGSVPAGAQLYVAVDPYGNGYLLFISGENYVSDSVGPLSSSPASGQTYNALVSIPTGLIPKTYYVFYAALLDSSGQLVSPLAVESCMVE